MPEVQQINALGQLVSVHRQRYGSGYQTYAFQPKDRLPAGMYTYSLRTSYGWASKQLILVE